MTKVRMKRDVGVTCAWVYKLICDCGWNDRFYEKESLPKAKAHLLRHHNGGIVLHNNKEIEVTPT